MKGAKGSGKISVRFYLLAALLLLLGTQDTSRGAFERGDKQMSFGDSSTSEYSIHQDDRASPPSPSGRDSQAAASSAQSQLAARPSGTPNGNQSRTTLEGANGVQPLQDSETALKEGQSAGQVSNVPGTNSTSPNGTSNFYGTGGIPVFPEDIQANGKTGNGGG